MGRDRTKTEELHLDHAAGIRKLSNGNLKYFFNTFIRDEIPALEFYRAMRFAEPITTKVEQAIDEAYFEAIASLGLTHEQLDEIPTYTILLQQLKIKFEYVISETENFTRDEAEKYQRAFKFYDHLFSKNLIEFKPSKKSKVI